MSQIRKYWPKKFTNVYRLYLNVFIHVLNLALINRNRMFNDFLN